MDHKVEEALNTQINEEGFSSYLYLSMAAYFESLNLSGCANWMYIQTREENDHMMKIFDFIAERGGRVKLQAIREPQLEWRSPLDAFQAAYKHEQHITGCINKLVDVAREVGDKATENFLQWFVSEQVEEEANVDKIVGDFKLAGDNPQMLLMLDRELATRTYVPPAAAE